MSLDVYLTLKGTPALNLEPKIYIREDGARREISRAEWDRRFPEREPVVVQSDATPDTEVYTANITHNLNKMADAAGIYQALWRPEEIGIKKASQLIPLLAAGLNDLQTFPEKFTPLNPENGWGSYDGLVEFVRGYLSACRAYPEAEVRVWR